MGRVRPLEPPVAVSIGCDIGKIHDPTALCVTEQRPGDLHVVRYLERLPLGTSYPDVAARLSKVYRNTCGTLAGQLEAFDKHDRIISNRISTELERCSESWPLVAQEYVWVMVDATGCGLPLVDFMRERAGIPQSHLCAVMLTAGESSTVRRGRREGSCSKSHMVSRLQTLIAGDRLQLPDTDEAKVAIAELTDFEQDTSTGIATYNARQGSHDDLITALALSCLVSDQQFECGVYRYA